MSTSRDEYHYPERRGQHSLIGRVSAWYHKWQPALVVLGLFLIGTGWTITRPIERIERIEERLVVLEAARELTETQAALTCLTGDVRALVLSRMPCARLLRDIETPDAERRRREIQSQQSAR